LCTGNSCRSQMAEGLVNAVHLGFPDPARARGSNEEIASVPQCARPDARY
jgi:hypothetical protein